MRFGLRGCWSADVGRAGWGDRFNSKAKRDLIRRTVGDRPDFRARVLAEATGIYRRPAPFLEFRDCPAEWKIAGWESNHISPFRALMRDI
jgi:hypothetical protein